MDSSALKKPLLEWHLSMLCEKFVLVAKLLKIEKILCFLGRITNVFLCCISSHGNLALFCSYV